MPQGKVIKMTDLQATTYLHRVKQFVQDGELKAPDSVIGYYNLLKLMHIQQSSMRTFAASLTKRIKGLEDELHRNTVTTLVETLDQSDKEGGIPNA
jgi:hypothetical protein